MVAAEVASPVSAGPGRDLLFGSRPGVLPGRLEPRSLARLLGAIVGGLYGLMVMVSVAFTMLSCAFYTCMGR
jgi:hypothetical protein